MNNLNLKPKKPIFERWKEIEPDNLKSIRAILILKHGSLTKAAAAYGIRLTQLSDVLGNRTYVIKHINMIREDINLSVEVTLKIWPELKSLVLYEIA